MTNQRCIYSVFVIGLMLSSCLHEPPEQYTKNADFSSKTRILRIDFESNPDTSLQQIILLSGIRNSGYGILLNVDNFCTETDIKKIKTKFKKQDINVVHEFSFDSDQNISGHILTGIERADFIWVLSKNDSVFNNPNFEKINRSIEKAISNNGILIVNQQ